MKLSHYQRKKKRKAEIASNIVMYIMTGVVVIAVIAFGVKQMLALNKDVGAIKCLNFQQEFKERLVKDRAYGTVDKDIIDVDCEIDRICFINLNAAPPSPPLPSPNDPNYLHPVIYDLWQSYYSYHASLPATSSLKKNVFLINDQEHKVVGSFYVAGMKPASADYLCLEVKPGGYIAPIIRGKGKYVSIEAAP